MILFRASFVVMVSVFLRRSQHVVGAPVIEDDVDGELLKPDPNLQDEVNFIGGISTSRGPEESKTKEVATEGSADNPFANFNPNNTIAYSSSNILPNDATYDMIFIPSSEVPSDTDDLALDLSSGLSENDRVSDDIDVNMGEDELVQVSMASENPGDMQIGVGFGGEGDYGDYLSYIGEYSDWRELSWLTEFSEVSLDENVENTLVGAGTEDEFREASEYTSVNDLQNGWSEKDTDEHANALDGYEEAIDGVKTRKKRSFEDLQEISLRTSQDEEDEDLLGEDSESSLSSSYFDDISFIASESSDHISSVSEEISEVGGVFQDVDPKRADIEKVLARYPRPGVIQLDNWNNDRNDIPFYEGERREKRGIDLFKYYAVNFPTLEGMRKRGSDDFREPFDFDNIANDLVPSVSKSKRSLHAGRQDNDAWDALDEVETLDSSSYVLGPFNTDAEHSENESTDIYMPEMIDDSNELGHFLSHVVSVSPEFESRRGHRFDIPDYNEGKYLAYRSANLNPSSKPVPTDYSVDVPDPAELLKLYEIVKHLNPQDVIDARKPRMYLPGPHAGYQAYGNEIHRGMFGSKRRVSNQALLNPLPRSLKRVYRPMSKPSNTHHNDVFLNTIDEYLESEAWSEGLDIDTSSSIEAEIDDGADVDMTLAELMKEIEELTIMEKLFKLVRLTDNEDEQYRR